MRYIMPVLALATALVAAALVIDRGADSVSAVQETVTVTMTEAVGPDGGGSQTGTATLTAVDASQTEVVINIDPSPDGADVEQPAHVHAGTCDNLPGSLGEIVYPLENVVNGTSTTTIDAGLDSLQTGDFAINVHESGTALGVYVSCGNIPAAAAPAEVPTAGGAPPADGGVPVQVYLLIAAGALAVAGGAGAMLRARQR